MLRGVEEVALFRRSFPVDECERNGVPDTPCDHPGRLLRGRRSTPLCGRSRSSSAADWYRSRITPLRRSAAGAHRHQKLLEGPSRRRTLDVVRRAAPGSGLSAYGEVHVPGGRTTTPDLAPCAARVLEHRQHQQVVEQMPMSIGLVDRSDRLRSEGTCRLGELAVPPQSALGLVGCRLFTSLVTSGRSRRDPGVPSPRSGAPATTSIRDRRATPDRGVAGAYRSRGRPRLVPGTCRSPTTSCTAGRRAGGARRGRRRG